ncbi:reverse transcriptase domain-containing protein [Bordetella muralis]|uniref:reverse transcriptase domain-containing protein n=1 Tax=Bordetella muralis TaxID=1649130 RepID=UPI0039EE8D95
MSAAKEFRDIFWFGNLGKIYEDRVKDSGAIGLDRVRPGGFQKSKDEQLKIVSRKVLAGSYKFTPYKEKLISKGKGKFPRVISIPTVRDRIVLRGLCDLLAVVYPDRRLELPQLTIGSLSEALRSGEYSEYVKIDLKDFYPSIPHDLLLRSIKRKIRKKEIVDLILRAVENPTVPSGRKGTGAERELRGVPQGLSISNILAEIALTTIDRLFGGNGQCWYKRYVDDILILTPAAKGRQIGDAVISALKSLGLEPHPFDKDDSKSKVGSLTESFSFLGYQVTNGSISIRRESVLKFESSLAGIFTSYRHNLATANTKEKRDRALSRFIWRLNLRLTGCIFKERRLGWVFYFSQINDTSCLRAVMNTVDSLLLRFALNSKVCPKSLIKVLYESRRRQTEMHRYIPNFDVMDVGQKRKILLMRLPKHRVRRMSDEQVEMAFDRNISIAIRELEADLASVS